jgi:hypothetical protein
MFMEKIESTCSTLKVPKAATENLKETDFCKLESIGSWALEDSMLYGQDRFFFSRLRKGTLAALMLHLVAGAALAYFDMQPSQDEMCRERVTSIQLIAPPAPIKELSNSSKSSKSSSYEMIQDEISRFYSFNDHRQEFSSLSVEAQLPIKPLFFGEKKIGKGVNPVHEALLNHEYNKISSGISLFDARAHLPEIGHLFYPKHYLPIKVRCVGQIAQFFDAEISHELHIKEIESKRLTKTITCDYLCHIEPVSGRIISSRIMKKCEESLVEQFCSRLLKHVQIISKRELLTSFSPVREGRIEVSFIYDRPIEELLEHLPSLE